MVIPFVIEAEGLDAVGDGVIGEGLEIGCPVGIDGPVEIAEAAHPFEEFFGGHADLGFGGPVDHDEAGSLFHEGVEFLEIGIEEVIAVAGAEHDDGVGALEDGGVGGVSIFGEDDGFDGEA